MIRAILVDDKEEHLNDLKKELRPYSKDVEIIGAFTDPYEATPQIIHLKPDVLFLDIQMPGMSGFKVAASVKEICSNVIFLTSYLTDSSETDPVIIAKDNIKDLLPKVITKLIAKLKPTYESKLPVISAYKLQRISLLGRPNIKLFLLDDKEEESYTLELRAESYNTLQTFVEVKKGVSEDIKSSYVHYTEHNNRFTNLYKYMIDFIEDVNKKLSEHNIVLSKDDFFKKEKMGKYVFALPLEKIDSP
jgi:CheY-like chemotaxis protein